MSDSAPALRPGRFARALRAVQAIARELALAALLAAAVLIGYGASGGKIEIWKRAHLWYEEKALWAQQHGLGAEAALGPASSDQATATSRLGRNPFLAFTGEAAFRLHPLIDVAGALFRDYNRHFFEERDYFGFRNNFDAYFDPGDYTYIVMTGNSELVGISHNVTIAQNLQDILNARSRKKYRVLNLGLNSATSATEINYFVNLAFNLHPEFVISHAFTTDIIYGYKVPPEFQSMGLFYLDFQTTWWTMIHAGGYDPKAYELAISTVSENHLLQGVVRNLERYRAVAEASGARFIFGLQKFDASHMKGTQGEAAYERVSRMYEKFKILLRNRGLNVDVIDFNTYPGIQLSSELDPIHTSEASSRRIAEIYADHILALEREHQGAQR